MEAAALRPLGAVSIADEVAVSIVVPVHNEERSLAPLLDEINGAMDVLGRPW